MQFVFRIRRGCCAVYVQEGLLDITSARMTLGNYIEDNYVKRYGYQRIVLVLDDVWDGKIITSFEIDKVCTNANVVALPIASRYNPKLDRRT